MAELISDFGDFYFYDCGQFGLFTLASETFQPFFLGTRTNPRVYLNKSKEVASPNQAKAIDRLVYPILKTLGSKRRYVDVIDVGAYIGTYSISLATAARYDGLKVRFHAFEPGATLDLLRINVDFNDLTGWITVHGCAVSDVDGYTFYHTNPGKSIGGQIFHADNTSIHRIVKTRTIDKLQKELKLSAPAFIKLDTQGHEHAIMGKAGSLIEKKSTVWQIEYLPWAARRPVEDGTFSEFLMRKFDVFDLMLHGYPKRIVGEEMGQMIRRMEAEKKFTDLLLVPKGAEFASAVLEQVEALAAAA